MSEKETSPDWLVDEGKNRIFVQLGSDRVQLHYTEIQHERYIELIESKQAETETSKDAEKPAGDHLAKRPTMKENLQSVRVSSMDVALIALNPKTELKYTKSDIEEKLDLDQIYLLAEVWLQRKVFSPSMEQSPLLKPVQKAANLTGR